MKTVNVFLVLAAVAAGCATERPAEVSAAAPAAAAEAPLKVAVYADRGPSGIGAAEWYRIVHDSPQMELKLVDGAVTVMMDGIPHVFAPGEEIVVKKGCSITLAPYIAHVFGPKPGTGDIVAGEVSKVNDDHTDNFFVEPVSRFADIEEDEPALHPLCNECAKI